MHFVIAGGGTGGHIYPAVAMAERLSDEGTVTMLARCGSLEERVYCEHGLHVETVRSAPLMSEPGRLLVFVRATMGGIADARRIMSQKNTDAFIGTGGYVSVPGIIAASMRRIPIFLLEQNTVMGRANRLFQHCARRIFLGFPVPGVSGDKFILSGNPLRREVYVALADARNTVPARQGLLFLGGSGGATFINDLFLRTIDELDRHGRSTVVSVVTGTDDFARVKNSLASMRMTHVKAQVSDYEKHPERLYASAKVAVTRGGALALTELASAGIFTVMVPYPYAMEGHQSSNAAYVESLGLGVRIEQSSFAFDRYMSIVAQALDASDDKPIPPTGIFAGDAAKEIASTIVQAVFRG